MKFKVRISQMKGCEFPCKIQGILVQDSIQPQMKILDHTGIIHTMNQGIEGFLPGIVDITQDLMNAKRLDEIFPELPPGA
jgi:hypothetical protein